VFEEVFAYDGSFEQRLTKAREDLNDDYFTLFDGHLVDSHQALLADPSNIEAKVDFVTLYHMVIEGTLALTGQFFQTDNMEKRGILSGHLEGFRKISQDEHRHVAYGTWYLQQKVRDPDLAQRVQDKLAETLPAAAGVLVPPGYKLGDDYEYLGYSSVEMNEFAFTALSRRLKVIGVGLPALAA
jgi:ribonucleoside-diphosphate reductase beta chain